MWIETVARRRAGEAAGCSARSGAASHSLRRLTL